MDEQIRKASADSAAERAQVCLGSPTPRRILQEAGECQQVSVSSRRPSSLGEGVCMDAPRM
eukprot:2070941-Prymnesium_polylepis.1